MDISFPNIMSLNPQDLVAWCKMRKKSLELSNQKLSEQSGVPVGTIDRIMSGNYPEFKYSSIQPLIKVLLRIDDKTPLPNENDEKQSEYYETIEGYKLVMENKNHMIAEMSRNYESLIRQVEFLKQENLNKQKMLDSLNCHVSWMESVIDELRGKSPKFL